MNNKTVVCLLAILFIYLKVLTQTFPGDYSIYIYYSNDGTTFSNPIELIDSSDVPSLVEDSSGTIFCLYQCFKGGQSSPYMGKIGVKTSIDNGVSWSSNGYISISGLSGSSDKAFDPTITITPDNKYRLYFSYCPDNSTSLDSTCATYSAISNDGFNYVVESGVRFGAIYTPVIDPAVVYFDSIWHYTAPIPPPAGGGARYATSVDGINFNLIDSLGVGDTHYKWTGNLLNNGTSIRFYGYSDNVVGDYIWWSESTDGMSWSAYNFTNISEGKDPGITKLSNGNYIMLVPRLQSPLGYDDDQKLTSKIYPNPFSTQTKIRLHSNMNKKWSFSVYNVMGVLECTQINISDSEIIFNKGELNKGVYMYLIQLENGKRQRGKLIVN